MVKIALLVQNMNLRLCTACKVNLRCLSLIYNIVMIHVQIKFWDYLFQYHSNSNQMLSFQKQKKKIQHPTFSKEWSVTKELIICLFSGEWLQK